MKKKKENKSSWERNDGDGENDDDPDDRKPPAKEVVVINRPKKQQNDGVNGPRSTEDTAEAASIVSSSNASCSASTPGVDDAAAAHSPASLSSPAYSPVAASPTTPAACMPPSSVMTLSSPTPNMKKQQQQMPSSSSLVDRLDETVANIADTSNTIMNTLVRLMVQSSSRSRQQQLAVLLMSTTILSTMTFICCILPMTALIAISIATASFGLLLQQALQYAVQEFNFRIENGRGLSELFNLSPESSLWQTLTRTTLHEYMTDDSFAIEYRYLLLYFIPGISPQQLNAYIDRLEPRHRDLLRRPGGIGQLLLGPTAMRAMMGRRQWEALIQAQQQQQQQQQPQSPLLQQNQQQSLLMPQSTTTPPPPLVQHLLEMQDRQSMENATPARALFPRVDVDDDDSSNCSCSDLGLDVSPNDLAGGLSESQATRMARQLGLVMMNSPPPTTTIAEASTPTAIAETPTAPNAATNEAAAVAVVLPTTAAASEQEERDRALLLYQQEEEAVVTEAFWSSYNYFYDMAVGAMRDAIIPSRRTVVRSSIAGLGVGIFVPTTLAVGIYNFWASAYSASGNSSRSNGRSSSTLSFLSRVWSSRGNDNSRRSLWATALLGSGVAGVVLYAAYSRSSSSSTESDEKKKKNDSSDQPKK